MLTGLIWAADSMEMMLLSFLAPKLKEEWNLVSPTDGLIGAVVFVGLLIGSLTFAIASDKYGRRRCIIIGCIICSLFGFLSGLAPNIIIMLLLRFIVGIAVGAVPVAYTLFAEYSPSEYRGRILMLQTGLWSLGALLSVALAYICLSLYQSWRWYLIASSFPFFIATILTYFYLPESARYLLIKGDIVEAEAILQDIAATNNSELPSYAQLKPESNTDHKRGQIKDLFNRTYRNNSIIALSIFSLLVFCYYGISFISARYFEKVSTMSSDEYWMMAISTASELPSILFGWILLDRIGRKRTLSLSVGIFGVCLFILLGFAGFKETEIAGVITVSVARMNINLAFSTVYIYFTEYYPTAIRSTALGLGSSFGRIFGVMTSFVSEDMSIKHALLVYFITTILLYPLTRLLSKDTLGQDLPSTIPTERDGTDGMIELTQQNQNENDVTSPLDATAKNEG